MRLMRKLVRAQRAQEINEALQDARDAILDLVGAIEATMAQAIPGYRSRATIRATKFLRRCGRASCFRVRGMIAYGSRELAFAADLARFCERDPDLVDHACRLRTIARRVDDIIPTLRRWVYSGYRPEFDLIAG